VIVGKKSTTRTSATTKTSPPAALVAIPRSRMEFSLDALASVGAGAASGGMTACDTSDTVGKSGKVLVV
jgi:hypothetical protein